MSENDDTIQVPQSLTFEPLGYLANQSPTDDPDEPRQLDTYANELTTNIIKDASQTASRSRNEIDNTGMDNTNQLNFPQPSKQNQSENTTTALDKSEYSTNNGPHDENGFDNEDIQNKMNGVIQDIQSHSGNDTNHSRKSVASNHLHDNQINNSSSTIIDPLLNHSNEGPRQSVTESTSVDHHVSNEQSLPSPIRQNENSSGADEFFGIKTGPTNTSANIDDLIDQHRSEQENAVNNRSDDNDEFFNTKVATLDDDQRPTSVIKQNALDETTRFGTNSSSRVQSASSKQSVRVTPDEQSTSGDEKRTEINSSKLPDDTGNDTDRDNQEVAIIARRPSRALSPLDRPRSPTPNDSLNVSNNHEPPSPTDLIKDDDNQQKQIYEPSTSRASSSRTHQFITTDEQSKLIKPGEQLQIPTDDHDGERLNSPPTLPKGIKSLGLINPLVGSSLVQHEQDQSQLSSETDRRSLNTSTISNEKIIDGDVVSSKSRRESNISQQQINNTDQKSTSRRESQVIEQTPQISISRRASTSQQQDELDSHREQPVVSRRTSNATQEPTSHRNSFVAEQQSSSRRESTILEQKPSSRKPSTASEQQPPSKRGSVAPEQATSSRRESTALEQTPTSRKASTASEQQSPSKRGSVAPEQATSSRRESTALEQTPTSRKASTASEQQPSSKRGSIVPEQQSSSRRESTALQQTPTSRKASTASEQQAPSKRGSIAPEKQIPSRRESTNEEQKIASRKGSTTFEQQDSSKRESPAPEQQVSSRRESHVSGQQTSHRRQISFDQQEQKSSSKPVSRKTSIAEQQQQQIPSRRESQQQLSSSRRSSLNVIDSNHQHEPYSSHKETPTSDTDDVPIRTATKHKQERTKSIDKRKKSSSTTDENDHRRSSFQQRSGQQSKRNSNIITDETVVTPLVIDSSKARQHNEKHSSITDYSYDQSSTSKLPPVNSSFQQEKPHLSETLNKQQIPISNRSEIKHLSSSHATSPSGDDQPAHWTKQIPIPSIHLTDDDVASSSREDQPRPQSPNVEQIAERNQAPSPPLTTTSKGKKRIAADGQKRKEQQRLSRRSTSADSIPHIPLVDDRSLDSRSDNNTNFDRHKRRHIKPRKKDVETNTDQTFDSQHQQRSFFDEKELSPQKPLKATKPLSDHLYPTRRRAPNKEQILTTPDTDAPTVRRTVKQTKDSNQDKDPVHVNVTVVVKKFAGTGKDGISHTTTEAFVEQKPQQYFEPVQHPTENKEQLEELNERPKSTEQQRTKSSEEKILEHPDRHTQSDTEQIITDQQKKRRRPKRISRTCQTYESVFRRMEREQQAEMRATSDTEKNIQTRKSQLRPRKKSPKKNHPVYLSSDSFRLEDLLPKQYHQSRRNISKSSAIARSLSPSSGKLLILRPTLPFHHTDAVNVHRVCLQYAIDLVPNEHLSSGTLPTPRNKLTVLKQSEQTNNLPMISASSTGVHVPTNRSNIKEKSASNRSEDYIHQRKNGGAV